MSQSPSQSTPKNPSKLSIADLIKKVEKEVVQPNPTLNDYLNGEAAEYFEAISEAMKLIGEYKSGTRGYDDLHQAEQDCIHLSAIHSYVSQMVGYLQGMSSRAESSRKLYKSKYAIAIKYARDEEERSGAVTKITEAEVDNASRTLATEFYNEARDMEVISRMMTAAYYSIGNFIDVLNSACNRTSKEKTL